MRIRSTCAALAVCLLPFAPCAFGSETALYRIFLTDGTALVSYGEYARVAGRVVFSVPLGALEPSPQLRLVSIADSAVDWARTESYSDAVRARRYADTRGEDDFAILSNQVASALNEVAFTKDPAERLKMAEQARANLAQWPKQNFGYRASDVTQLLALFDDVIAPLRAAAGLPQFELNLYATTVPPERPTLLPAPDPRTAVESAFVAAKLAQGAERVSLLESIAASLASVANGNGAGGWEVDLRARAEAELAVERRIDDAYAALARRTLSQAERRATRADVRGLQGLVASVLADDARLGSARPQEMTTLLAALDGHLDAARRLRLARDAWAMRGPARRAYRDAIDASLIQLRRSTRWLEDIRALAGPPPSALHALDVRLTAVVRALARVRAPAELDGAHETLENASAMALRAAQMRRRALQSNDMTLAWEASSAAAGALMLFERASDDIQTLTSRPQSR